MFRAAFSGLETQRNDMNTFVTNFTRMQEQQVTTMNGLRGALSKSLEKTTAYRVSLSWNI